MSVHLVNTVEVVDCTYEVEAKTPEEAIAVFNETDWEKKAYLVNSQSIGVKVLSVDLPEKTSEVMTNPANPVTDEIVEKVAHHFYPELAFPLPPKG